MASGSVGEVVHCPNCKEDVPKTLYCLNCGFPLYKDEEKTEGGPEVAETKDAEPEIEDVVVNVDDAEEKAEQIESIVEPEKLQDTQQVDEVPAVPEPPTTTVEVPDKPIEPEQEPSIGTVPESEVMVTETTSQTQAEVKMQASEVVVEPPKTEQFEEEPLSKPSEVSESEATKMVEDFEISQKIHVPDALSKDLMENIAKNLSLKIMLVKLYREGRMKEETFTKLFEGYMSEGTVWMQRREEMIKKLNTEVEEMEESYFNASESLELLEIKKTIGDVSEDEYSAKAPAYKWDIDHYDFQVAERRNKIAYLEDIGVTMTGDELKSLRELASLQYNTVDALQISKEETLTGIKGSLYEAIKILG